MKLGSRHIPNKRTLGPGRQTVFAPSGIQHVQTRHSRIYVCPQSRWLDWPGSSDCRVLCPRESSPPHLNLWDHEQLAESTRTQGAQFTGQPWISTRCPEFHISIGDISGHRRYNTTATDNDLVLFLLTIFPYIMPCSEFILSYAVPMYPQH